MEIILDRMNFFARHGVLPQERTTGGRFQVSLRLQVDDEDVSGALAFDELEGTVDYSQVYEEVSHQMSEPSGLLEHVSARIASALLRRFGKIREVDIALAKCAPPIPGFSGSGATVHCVFRRSLVAWDFDGTIADTSDGIVRTMTVTFRRLGYSEPGREAICRTIGLPLSEGIAQLMDGIGETVDDEVVAQATELYRELFEELGTTGVTLFPGVAQEMRCQRAMGQIVAIATSRGHQSVKELCQKLGILDYIDHIVACEDVSAHKPDPAPVHRLCELARVAPADVTVIGDTTYDIEMALRARVPRRYGVAWGNHTPEQLIEAGATRIIDAF